MLFKRYRAGEAWFYFKSNAIWYARNYIEYEDCDDMEVYRYSRNGERRICTVLPGGHVVAEKDLASRHAAGEIRYANCNVIPMPAGVPKAHESNKA